MLRALLLACVPALAFLQTAAAQVREPVFEEPTYGIEELGKALTPMGAVRAGTANRFIPEWTGGLNEPVKGWERGKPHPDPFFEDSRWFIVTPAELERYKVRLSGGLRELLRRHETFEIFVYPARRTAAAPQAFYDATIANARTARLAENGLAVTGARVGIPFPAPTNGWEAMWNHLLRWRGYSFTRVNGVALPDGFGAITVSLYREDFRSPYAMGQEGPLALLHRRTGLLPADIRDGVLVLGDALNPIRRPRVAWYRPPGSTDVLHAPDFASATPDPAFGGLQSADMQDMFTGVLDRYEYTLLGKRAMYAPYNANRLENPALAPEDFLWPYHPNPSFLRYELHRLWIVEARLKAGYRNRIADRIFYLDEDSWQIVMADHYDREGRLIRYSESHGVAYSHVPVFAPTMELTYDLENDRYVASGLDNQTPPPVYDRPLPADAFTREALLPPKRRAP